GVLGARESILAPAEQKALAEFLCLLVGFGDEGRNQIAEIFGACLVTLPLRFVGVVLPQVAGCRESRAESEVRISTLRAPQHGFRAERARNPHLGMWFLIRQRPRVHVAIVEMLALVTPGSRLGPRLHDKIVRFLEILPVVGRIRVVEELLAASATHPSRDE